METRAHHVLVGAFTLAVAALFMAFLYFSGRLTTEEEFIELEVVFTEAVTGLGVGGTVNTTGSRSARCGGCSSTPRIPRG